MRIKVFAFEVDMACECFCITWTYLLVVTQIIQRFFSRLRSRFFGCHATQSFFGESVAWHPKIWLRRRLILFSPNYTFPPAATSIPACPRCQSLQYSCFNRLLSNITFSQNVFATQQWLSWNNTRFETETIASLFPLLQCNINLIGQHKGWSVQLN